MNSMQAFNVDSPYTTGDSAKANGKDKSILDSNVPLGGAYERNIRWEFDEHGKIHKEKGRNNYLHAFDSGLRRIFDMSYENAWETLQRRNEEVCEPPLDDDELQKIHDNVWKRYQPEVSIEGELYTL